jgi:hypothetical protein
MVESAACMPQNLRLELIQSLFFVNDGKSAAFVPQNSNGAMDGRRTTDRPSYPDLLRSQMGYIMHHSPCLIHCSTVSHLLLSGGSPALHLTIILLR